MKKLKNSTLQMYKHIHIIDLSDVLYRAYWSKPTHEFTGKKTGHFTGLCVFCSKLYELLSAEESSCAIFAFDAPNNSAKRRKIFPEYKRSDARVKLKEQAPTMHLDNSNFRKIISIFPNMFCVEKSEYEADDLIVYLTYKFHKTHKIYIYARDYDLFFLQHRCKALMKDAITNTINIKEKLKKKYRITNPKLLPYIKILNGDKSDNIPVIFDLRKTKKFVERWYEDKKVSLYCPELLKEKEAIKRNIKLVMPLQVKDGVEFTDSSDFTDKEKFEVLVNHNLMNIMQFLVQNKNLLNVRRLYGKARKQR